MEVLWISAISSCCTSPYDITRDRPGAKYLWLMCIRQRTKWISCKVRDVDDSSTPFGIALKNNIANRMPIFISFCNKHRHIHLTSTVYYSIYWKKFIRFQESTYVWLWAWGYHRGCCPYLYQYFRNIPK